MNEALRAKSRPPGGMPRGKTPVALRHDGSQRGGRVDDKAGDFLYYADLLLQKIPDFLEYFSILRPASGQSNSPLATLPAGHRYPSSRKPERAARFRPQRVEAGLQPVARSATAVCHA